MTSRLVVLALATLSSLSACATPPDPTRALERITMEEAQATIIHTSGDCSQMTHLLAQWYADNRAAVDANDAWWNALPESSQSLAAAGYGDRTHEVANAHIEGMVRCGSRLSWFSMRGTDPVTEAAPVRRAPPPSTGPVVVAAFVPSPNAATPLAGAALAADALPIPADAPRRGASAPRVVVHVFTEFESPFSERLAPTLDRLMTEYGDRVLLVFRNLPLPFHAHSEPAARAALEVRAQLGDGAFWAFHDVLFAHRSALTDADLVSYAAAVPGINLPRFQTALATHLHGDAISADVAAAAELHYAGTPTLRIGHTVVNGAQPYDTLRAAVEAERSRWHRRELPRTLRG